MRCKAGLFSRFVPLAPGDITGLTGWWDASDSSTLFDATSGGSAVAADGSVARIEDKSGNSRHFTQGTAGARPLRKTGVQNSLDVLRLDGSDDFLQSTFTFSNIFTLTQFTCFVVANAATISSTNFSRTFVPAALADQYGWTNFFGVHNTNELLAFAQFSEVTDTYAGSAWLVVAVTYNGSSLSMTVNGSSAGSISLASISSGVNFANYFIGRSSNATFFNGDVGEIITYNQAISTADREGLESVLMDKWAIT